MERLQEIETNLNPIAKEISERMTEQGFWDDWEDAVATLRLEDQSISAMASKRLASALQRALISEKLMLIITEPAEGMEAHRKARKAPEMAGSEDLLHLPSEDDEFERTPFEQHFKDTFEDEIADTFIRLLDLVGKLDIDIDFHIKHKSRYNASRAKRHGKLC